MGTQLKAVLPVTAGIEITINICVIKKIKIAYKIDDIIGSTFSGPCAILKN